jgi:hypothetical protein
LRPRAAFARFVDLRRSGLRLQLPNCCVTLPGNKIHRLGMATRSRFALGHHRNRFVELGRKTMKRMICLLAVLGLAVMLGCAQEKPEAAAKKIFEQQVAGHEGLQMDTSGLDYAIIEQSEDRAVVQISGLMPVKATIPLVKKQGKWVLGAPAEGHQAKEANAPQEANAH